MSRKIARLLDEPEHEVRKLIAKLEAKNGYPSHDVRHLAENIQKTRVKLADLGLDPEDTTAEELYHALLIKFQSDSRRFDEHFGVHLKSYDEKMAKAVELVTADADLPERWVLRNAAAKNLLRQHPPKHLMKRLGYRSVESLLKREDIAEIYVALSFMESSNWNRAQAKLVSSLETTDFEPRPPKIVALSNEKWGIGPDTNVLFSNDYGSLGLEPSAALRDAGLLALTVLLLDGIAGLDNTQSSQAAKFSPAAAWWADTDGLIASLAGGEVSLGLKDTAENLLFKHPFSNRILDSARQSFWRGLQERYQNWLSPEEDLLADFSQKIKIPDGARLQLAFEYAEDI